MYEYFRILNHLTGLDTAAIRGINKLRDKLRYQQQNQTKRASRRPLNRLPGDFIYETPSSFSVMLTKQNCPIFIPVNNISKCFKLVSAV